LTDQGCEFKATLNGHESNSQRCLIKIECWLKLNLEKTFIGTVSSLVWDAERKFLFSGSYDKTIICWDIGGQKGQTYDLQGHKDRLVSLIFLPITKQLVSSSNDGFIVVWDMKAKRKESPQWKESDYCEYCKKPFFWNVKAMWETKIVGKRQHHCRRCGSATCDECSKEKTAIPILGQEFSVRICNKCASAITDEE
jgi:WD40 repeat protein